MPSTNTVFDAYSLLIQIITCNCLMFSSPDCQHHGGDLWNLLKTEQFFMTRNKSDLFEDFYCPWDLQDGLWIGMGAAFKSQHFISSLCYMLTIFSPKLHAFKKLSLTNSCCSFPPRSEVICAMPLQTRCHPLPIIGWCHMWLLQPVCPRDQCRHCACHCSQQFPKAGREEDGKSHSKGRQKKPVPNKLSSKAYSEKTRAPQYFKENNCKMQ